MDRDLAADETGSLRRFALACTIVAAVALAAVSVVLLFHLVVLLVIGCVLAVLLDLMAEPLIARFPGPRGLWVGIAFVVALAVAGGFLALVIVPVTTQAGELAQSLPQHLASMEKLLDKLGGPHANGDRPTVKDTVAEKVPAVVASTFPFVVEKLEAAFDVLGAIFFGLFVAVAPGEHRRGFVHLWPVAFQPRVEAFIDEAAWTLRAWIGAVAIGMTIVGFLVTGGLYFLGVRYWLVFGLLSAVMELIPYAGLLLGSLGPVLACLIDGERRKAGLVLAFFVGVQALMLFVITPYLVKKRADVPSSLSIAAVLGLGIAAGAAGIVAAIPFVAIVLAAWRNLLPAAAPHALHPAKAVEAA